MFYLIRLFIVENFEAMAKFANLTNKLFSRFVERREREE